jgi:hypothetical protein
MTASGTVRQRTPHGQALRRLISRHPMATFLLQVFSISGMAVFAVLVGVLTRGRLAFRPPGEARRGQPPQRAARTASTEGSPILLAKGNWS